MRRIIHFLAKSLAVMLIAVSVTTAITICYARFQGLMVLSVQTGSMRPAIRPGAAVLVRRPAGKLAPGSIVSYQSMKNPKLIITHRIVSFDQQTGQVVTKGDSLAAADPPFMADRIIGRVERIVPVAGYGMDFTRQPVGLAVAVYVPGLVLISGEVRRLMRTYEVRRYRLRAYP